MPAGIPMPSFGYLHDTDLAPTIYVDNSNPACDNDQGTEEAPWCDLLRDGDSVSWSAGDVVSLRGGPYTVADDVTMRFDGTDDNPVIVRAATPVRVEGQGSQTNFRYEGQYGILEGIEFVNRTKHQVGGDAHHLVFRGIDVHNEDGTLIDFNPVFNVSGSDVLLHEVAIHDNRRQNDLDSHGVQAGSGSSYVWILDSEFYNNNGDSFQGCHECYEDPPHHVYIGRNVMHEDRENGVDLKSIHDVVVSENLMYGYVASGTSSGDAVVVGSTGYDENIGQGPRRVWLLNNEFRDSTTGVRVEGVQDVWIVGNVFAGLQTGLQIDDKQYREIMIVANVIDDVEDGFVNWNASCTAQTVVVENNIVGNVAGRHVDFPDCGNATFNNNLFWDAMDVRIGGENYTDAATLDREPFASMHLAVNPGFEPGSLRPGAGSPAVDAGAPIEGYLSTVEDAYGGDAHSDLTGALRPAGARPDVGAYER